MGFVKAQVSWLTSQRDIHAQRTNAANSPTSCKRQAPATQVAEPAIRAANGLNTCT